MTTLLREAELLSYVDGTETKPEPTGKAEADALALKKWIKADNKAQTRIELTVSDEEMIHLSGATTAAQMWSQLRMVKERKGNLGIMAARRRLYRMVAEEDTDIREHVSQMRMIQDELHLMGSLRT
jgi:hypothetical protein